MIVPSKKLFLVLPIVLVFVALLFLLIHICYIKNESNYKEMYEKLLMKQPPDISSIQFDDIVVKSPRHGWVELKPQVKIRVFLEGPATMVELFIAPVGTSTYKKQQLIDVLYPKNGVVEYIWNVPENTMGHFWVVTYNRDIGRKSFSINVIREELR